MIPTMDAVRYAALCKRRVRNQRGLGVRQFSTSFPVLSKRFVFESGTDVREFLERAKSELGIYSKEDWYSVSTTYLKKKAGGRSLFEKYKHLCYALVAAYPQEQWIMGRFQYPPRNVWKDPKNVKEYFEYWKKQLNIETNEQWYNVTRKQVEQMSGESVSVVLTLFKENICISSEI